MEFRSRQVRDALEALGLEEYDAAVSEALLELGLQPFTPLQVQGALRAAKLPPGHVVDVMDYLLESDSERQRGFASKLRTKIEAARLAAEAERAAGACAHILNI